MMRSVKALETYFKGYKAQGITTDEVKRYTKKRKEAGKANATINRELAALKRMFNLAYQQSPPKVAQVPYIPMLKENNRRTGFFEHEDYQNLMTHAAQYLKGVIALAYDTGMRKEEILSVKWNQIDMRRKTLRLEDAKSGKRTLPLSNLMYAYLKSYKLRNMGSGIETDYVFLNRDETDRIRDFRGAWKAACKKAGLGKRHFHDFRRTAVRNMIRAGVADHTAMQISGHKTRSVFDRYDIVDDKDITDALAKTKEYLQGKRKKDPSKVIQIRKIESPKVFRL
jgi:integrase